jgi:hypothetical protein
VIYIAKIIITAFTDYKFTTPEGTDLDGISLSYVNKDGSIEKTSITRANVVESGFSKEMVSDIFNLEEEPKVIEADFISKNGKAKIAKLTM